MQKRDRDTFSLSLGLELKLEKSKIEDAKEISDLLNLAYRGSEGWTTESDLVSCHRSAISDVEAIIEQAHSYYYAHRTGKIITACICLELMGDEAYIGSFAVEPKYQSQGLGNKILEATEQLALEHGAQNFTMVVLSKRVELISFYERRGYRKTGVVKDYPLHLNVGIPKHSSLTIEYLQKKHN